MKTLITHALLGAGCPEMELGDKLYRAGMAVMAEDGFGHEWSYSYINSLTVEQLQKLYEAVRYSIDGDDTKLLGILFVTGIAHASQ